MVRQRSFQVEPGELKLALKYAGQPNRSVRDDRVHHPPRGFRFAQEHFDMLASQVEVAANEASYPLPLSGDVAFNAVAGREASSPTRA
jgi:hypothetical protein